MNKAKSWIGRIMGDTITLKIILTKLHFKRAKQKFIKQMIKKDHLETI
jgi:hypothetical protein